MTGDCARLNRRFDLVEGQSSTVTAAHASTAATVATLQTAVTTLQNTAITGDVSGGAALTDVGTITKVIAPGVIGESSISDDGTTVTISELVKVAARLGVGMAGAFSPAQVVADFRNAAAVALMHLGNADSMDGAWWSAADSSNCIWMLGAYYDGASFWATAATAVMLQITQNGLGGLKLIYNTGLTPGATFVPVVVFQANASGAVSTYNRAATAGIGLTPVYAAPDYSNNSSSLGPLALSVGGGMAPAGSYLVGVTLVTHTTGTGNVILTITFNDGNRVETITLPLTLNAATALTPVYQIYTSGGANITFATAYTGPTGTYDDCTRLWGHSYQSQYNRTKPL